MFYAASEIVFWILLAALVGAGIGNGLAAARTVRLGKRLNTSGADAPLQRELETARHMIEDLSRRLQIAHETIRSGIENGAPGSLDPSDEGVAAGDTAPGRQAAPHDAAEASPHSADDPAEIHEPDVESNDPAEVGARLSARVASASLASMVEFDDLADEDHSD